MPASNTVCCTTIPACIGLLLLYLVCLWYHVALSEADSQSAAALPVCTSSSPSSSSGGTVLREQETGFLAIP